MGRVSLASPGVPQPGGSLRAGPEVQAGCPPTRPGLRQTFRHGARIISRGFHGISMDPQLLPQGKWGPSPRPLLGPLRWGMGLLKSAGTYTVSLRSSHCTVTCPRTEELVLRADDKWVFGKQGAASQ